jgi:bifunctional non-homologous end joining protein LigD
MSLEIYRQKRKFKKTSEPIGEDKKSGQNKLIFVIQEHHASHLHYDLRLEKDGVLKSWAVPKGPSMDPTDKRLAIQVEDHPLEYAKFSGIIPKGNYGAGSVKIWDKGTYIPLVYNDDHWEFILKGKKLNGEFSLVKISKDKNWLLIKMKEKENNKQKTDDKMPHKIKPMLATLVDEPFNKDNWFFEIKWDGYRAIAEIEKGKVKLYSRNWLSFENKFKKIVDELQKFNHDAVLDGEIVALDKNGKPSFQYLQNYAKNPKGELVYYVFDVLYLDGFDLQNKPLWERKKILTEIIPKKGSIVLGEEVKTDGIDFFEAAKKQGLEGIVAKEADSIYEQGVRGKNWLKIKTHLRQEAIICGFTKPRGNREKFGALILGIYEKGKLQYIGHTGTGFDEKGLNYLFKKLKPLEQKESPFTEVIKTNAPVTWVKPKLICEIKFQEWTGDGMMRQPVFMGLREDKKPEEVKKENPENEQKINISNIDKIFWPKEKYTKGDLINYYEEIADIILPYLKDKPESLLRFPNGIKGESFFHKNIDFAPDWIKTIKIKSESEKKIINYLLCQNKETLVYLINLGCIDLHPWNSRIENLNNPDYMILDLDPESEKDFPLIIKTALTAHEVMEKAGIPNYIKTSGLIGMHIYSPLNGKYTYEQTRELAQIVAIKINEKLPKITSVARSPNERKGKIYLDCFQNARGQTLAAPYCVRPIEEARVSTPLDWKEVNEKLKPQQFTIKNTLSRIEKKGDLFKPVLGPGFDIEKVLKKLS